ncbi:sulfotransferase [Frankia nepalensis]|nr:sulfotransferase [Frankia nepalensis]
MTGPDFVVAGPPESGGTRLAAALARHPALRLSWPDHDPRDGPSDVPGDAAEALWAETVTGLLGGSAGAPTHRQGLLAPYLLADFAAQQRLHERVAYPRLLVALRDPVDRAYAAWARARAAGTEPLADFVAALDAEPERARAGCGWGPRYAELGRYGVQLQRLYTLFSPSQVLLLRYPDLLAAPNSVTDRARAFLGVRPAPSRDRWARPGALDGTRDDGTRSGGPPPELRARVLDVFREDVRLLESVTSRAFGAWLTAAGERAPAASPSAPPGGPGAGR